MSESPLFSRAIARIDAVNSADPRTESENGEAVPKELLYARRMSAALERFAPDASEPLRLAARAQHIGRWRIPRSEFPDGRKGYRAWRIRLMELHAEITTEILWEVGYDEATAERVSTLLRKVGLKRDPDTQTLEDVICLVFLEHYFEDFAAQHDDDKVVGILKKTLVKMSARGREVALTLELGDRSGALVVRALSESSRLSTLDESALPTREGPSHVD